MISLGWAKNSCIRHKKVWTLRENISWTSSNWKCLLFERYWKEKTSHRLTGKKKKSLYLEKRRTYNQQRNKQPSFKKVVGEGNLTLCQGDVDSQISKLNR